MRRTALLIGTVFAANAFWADPNLCFSFLRSGDVVVSCEGQEFRVGETGKVNSFAIAEEQGVFAVVYSFLDATPARCSILFGESISKRAKLRRSGSVFRR